MKLRMIIIACTLLIPMNARAAEVVAEPSSGPGGSPAIMTDEYAFDSGFGTTNVAGYGAGGSMFWLNQFTVLAGFESITAVRIAWGTGPAGVPATALIFDDPNNDGNPTDITPANLLASSPIVSGVGPTNTFLTYPMPNVFAGNAGDSFFVGVCMSNLPGQFPARLDATDPDHRRSWFTSDPRTTGIDCSNPNGAADGPLQLWDSINTQFPGDWMVRANATAPVVSVEKFTWGNIKANLYR